MNINKILEGIFENSSVDTQKATKAATTMLPELLEQLKKNSENEESREGLNRALYDHQDDNLNDPSNYANNFDSEESKRMLSKIFGSNEQQVNERGQKASGLSSDDTKKVLMTLAPFVIASLAKKNKHHDKHEKSKAASKMLEKGLSGLFDIF